MPKVSTILYSIRQGFINIKRNRMFSLASIGTMTACLFLFGIFYFVLSNFKFMVKSAESNVGITVFFKEGVTEDKISVIGTNIRSRMEVESCRYISAEEAWERYKEQYLTRELAESFGEDNPLESSASFEVYLKDISAHEAVVKYIQGIDGVRQVNNSEGIAQKLDTINKAVAYISGAIIIILLCVAAFLISNTVTMGVSVRKREISIMKLIGASDFFIRAPFVVEGIIIGAVGAGIPLLALYFIYDKMIIHLMEEFGSDLSKVTFLSAGQVFPVLIPISLAIGVGIGFLGSSFTVRRQLNKIN